MTPIWVTLVVGGMGFLSTLGGVALTQWASTRRENATRAAAAEQQRRAERLARRALTYDARKAAYVQVLAVYREVDEELAADWGTDPEEERTRIRALSARLDDLLDELSMYASPEVGMAVAKANLETIMFAIKDSWGAGADARASARSQLQKAVRLVRSAIRADLDFNDPDPPEAPRPVTLDRPPR